MTFLDCTGVRALRIATSFAPGGCPVIIRSLSPMARWILELLDPGLESLRDLSASQELQDEMRNRGASEQELSPVEPGDSDLDA